MARWVLVECNQAQSVSEFEAGLEGDHAGRVVAAEAAAEQAGGGRGGVGERAEGRYVRYQLPLLRNINLR